jgi:hypothetical protein
MIEQTISHVVAELNSYLFLRSQTADRVLAASLFDLNGNLDPDCHDKVVVSVINVEKERSCQSVETYERRADGISEQVKPPVKVNLYLLFTANMSKYGEAMKALDQVICFFQHRPSFDFSSIRSIEEQQGRVVFQIYSMSLEQVNHLWSALGGKYMPSVVYKAGIFSLRDRQLEAEVPPVEEMVTESQGDR